MRPIVVLLAAALLAGAAPLPAQDAAADYARREAESAGLADFQGGFHGFVIAVAVIAAIGCLVWLSVDCAFCVHGHRHTLPPAEGRRHDPRP